MYSNTGAASGFTRGLEIDISIHHNYGNDSVLDEFGFAPSYAFRLRNLVCKSAIVDVSCSEVIRVNSSSEAIGSPNNS